MTEELTVAIAAAKKGADKALSYFTKPLDIETKSDKTFVTNADKETEKVIIEEIKKSFPDAKFVGEESGGSRDEAEFWTIDPIDGTRSFIRGIDTWCILIALCKNKEIVLGVSYYPLLNTLVYAQKGAGASWNDKQIHVSDIAQLSHAFVSYGSLKYFPDKSAVMKLSEAAEGTRSPECTLAACLVAKGSFDAQIDMYGKLWDFAPLKVIIEEAGGKITRTDGSAWSIEGEGAIVSNGLIHDQILDIFHKKT